MLREKRRALAAQMLWIVAIGLLLAGLSVWVSEWLIDVTVSVLWGQERPISALYDFLQNAKAGLAYNRENHPAILYGLDWLAFAHIALAILFAGAAREPVRNIWVIESGLIMTILVTLMAMIFVPIRGLPLIWIAFDGFFALAFIPLWIARVQVKHLERSSY